MEFNLNSQVPGDFLTKPQSDNKLLFLVLQQKSYCSLNEPQSTAIAGGFSNILVESLLVVLACVFIDSRIISIFTMASAFQMEGPRARPLQVMWLDIPGFPSVTMNNPAIPPHSLAFPYSSFWCCDERNTEEALLFLLE